MRNTVFLAILISYFLISAVLSYREIARLMTKSMGEKERLRLYRATILEGLLMMLIVMLAIGFADIKVFELGVRSISINLKQFNIWLTTGTFIICGVLLVLLLYQMIGYKVSNNYRRQLVNILEKQRTKENHYSRVLTEIMLPKTRREKRWFTVVSATAAITEELFYRGILFYLITASFPELPVGVRLVAGAALFGLAHSYQGLSGFLRTWIYGGLFGALAIASGSLLPGILLHFLVDFSSNFLFVLRPDKAS